MNYTDIAASEIYTADGLKRASSLIFPLAETRKGSPPLRNDDVFCRRERQVILAERRSHKRGILVSGIARITTATDPRRGGTRRQRAEDADVPEADANLA